MTHPVSSPRVLTASIVLYKSDAAFLSSVIQDFFAGEWPEVERILFLIDNSPTDELKALAETPIPQQGKIVYQRLNHNVGFGRAHNVAFSKIAAAGSRYHVVINPDVRFGSEVLPTLMEFMENNPAVGLVMPNVTFPDGSLQYLCKKIPSPVDVFVRRFVPFKKIKERINSRYELRYAHHATMPIEVPNLSGCFMFLRTQAIAEVGGFDERFFMYAEDLDLSRRIGALYRTVCYPMVSISHEFHRGSYKDVKLLHHHVVSMIRYFNKWGWICDAQRLKINQRCLSRQWQD